MSDRVRVNHKVRARVNIILKARVNIILKVGVRVNSTRVIFKVRVFSENSEKKFGKFLSEKISFKNKFPKITLNLSVTNCRNPNQKTRI